MNCFQCTEKVDGYPLDAIALSAIGYIILASEISEKPKEATRIRNDKGFSSSYVRTVAGDYAQKSFAGEDMSRKNIKV